MTTDDKSIWIVTQAAPTDAADSPKRDGNKEWFDEGPSYPAPAPDPASSPASGRFKVSAKTLQDNMGQFLAVVESFA